MTIQELLAAMALAGAGYALGQVLKARKGHVLELVSRLVQAAEAAVADSGMGPEKKALVLAQLKSMGVKGGAWLDRAIDRAVEELNRHSAWLLGQSREVGHER